MTVAPRLYPRRVRWRGWQRRRFAGLRAARLAARLHSPARMWLRSCLLALAVAFGATACDQLDCFDGAQLESAYRTGEAQAAAENQAAFERGRTDGLAATREDGARCSRRRNNHRSGSGRTCSTDALTASTVVGRAWGLCMSDSCPRQDSNLRHPL